MSKYNTLGDFLPDEFQKKYQDRVNKARILKKKEENRKKNKQRNNKINSHNFSGSDYLDIVKDCAKKNILKEEIYFNIVKNKEGFNYLDFSNVRARQIKIFLENKSCHLLMNDIVFQNQLKFVFFQFLDSHCYLLRNIIYCLVENKYDIPFPKNKPHFYEKFKKVIFNHFYSEYEKKFKPHIFYILGKLETEKCFRRLSEDPDYISLTEKGSVIVDTKYGGDSEKAFSNFAKNLSAKQLRKLASPWGPGEDRLPAVFLMYCHKLVNHNPMFNFSQIGELLQGLWSFRNNNHNLSGGKMNKLFYQFYYEGGYKREIPKKISEINNIYSFLDSEITKQN